VDARHCYSIEPLVRRYGLDRGLELGALLEPLGVARRALTRARVRADDRIVVVGTGPIGLGIIMLAREAGVTQIVAFDLIDSRVRMAEAAGARAFNVASLTQFRGGVDDAIRDAFGGQRASLAVEAAGTVEAFDTAFAALENRGRLLVLGRMPARVPLDTNALLSKALTVIGSRGHAGEGIFRELIRHLTEGPLDPSALVTARFGIHQLQEAFAYAREASGAKTLIRMEA
jgi:threonine dehydrogenase-like Zn-dependent dehydrogenase